MENDTPQDIMDALGDLLDREREALLEGDLEMIGRLLAHKESLIDALNAQVDKPDQVLEALHTKVLRNQELLDQALRGIRAVASRISALRRVRTTLETYDKSGRKTAVSDFTAHQLEKRA